MGWWSDKINGGQQPQQYAPPPQQYVHPQAYAPAPQYPVQQQHPQQQPHTQGTVHLGGMDVPVAVLERGNQKNGAAKHERQSCPECGDPRYFARDHNRLRKLNTNTGQMVPPAPICEACGYNGMFEQFGNQMALQTDEE